MLWEDRPILATAERPPWEIYVDRAGQRWVAEDEVTDLPLHPGFAASWERLRTVAASIPLSINPES